MNNIFPGFFYLIYAMKTRPIGRATLNMKIHLFSYAIATKQSLC